MKKILIQLICLICISNQAIAAANPEHDLEITISQAAALREQGNLQQAIDLLNSADTTAANPATQARIAGELGIAHLQARHYDHAETLLQKAYAFFSGTERARYAIYLGNLALIHKHSDDATRYYQEALQLSGGNIDLRLSAGLNLARLAPDAERLEKLSALSDQMAALKSPEDLTRHHLNLGNQARLLGGKGLKLAYTHLEQARALSLRADQKRLQVEALDGLAQLYEDQHRLEESGTLTTQAIGIARTLDNGMVADLLIKLEWRLGRLMQAAGREQQALAAYQRAVHQIELVRQDIPVEYEDGQSSFRSTLEPIYLAYVDLQLQQLDKLSAEHQAARLLGVLDTMELIKQTELQDFLGDRCAVETVQGGSANLVPAGTAVLYPILLSERIELLLKTSDGIVRRTVQVKSATLRSTAAGLAASLRAGRTNYLHPSRQLYDWLLKPFDDIVQAQHIQTLVVASDGVLRLIPFGALYDGNRFAIEKYAISTVTGMTVTNTAAGTGRKLVPLLAGVSTPGRVVERLGPVLTEQIFRSASPGPAGPTKEPARDANSGLSSIRSADATDVGSGGRTRSAAEFEQMREQLSLPGVKQEITALGTLLGGVSLLDTAFTVHDFRVAAESGDYRVVHIASHGVFGGTAESSFIMAHDDVISMNGLQSLLSAEKFQKNPIELLTLSACETAEGNDRAPLGIAGAAMKARARSILGTLWPVEDNAARTLMEEFYSGISRDKMSKTAALRQAQINLLRQPSTAHPLFWAPFVLIGNWL